MAGETQAQALGEIIAWLEQQLRGTRDEQAKTLQQVDQLRRQIHDVAEQVELNERSIREVDPKFIPFRGIPEKIRAIDESTEHIRHEISQNRSEVENALRILRAEAEADRMERGETSKRIERTVQNVGLIAADVGQVQQQTSQVSQSLQMILERQRELEARTEQFVLRLDRAIEVNRDLEERIKTVLTADQDARFEVVFERLQVVGEMVKRNEDLIGTVVNERSLRQEVIDEVSVWRQEHARIDGRLATLEEVSERLLAQVDKVHGEITLLEGRHSGLGERVAGIRRDIAEVVDGVRAEFAKYNQMVEKQRRKQIQMLEQELRETKFHAFRPPEEP